MSGASFLTGLAGCLGSDSGELADNHDWPMHAFDPANTGHTPARGPSEPVTLWTREIGRVESSPVVGDDTVYAGSGSLLHAMDLETGEDHWTAEVDGFLGHSPAVDQDTVYVLARPRDNPHVLVAFDLEGDTRWSTSIPDINGVGAPMVLDGIVYVYSIDAVYAFGAESGEEVWSEEEFPAIPTYFALVDGVVHTGRTALDAKSGEQRWEQDEDFPDLHTLGLSGEDGMLYCATNPHGNLLGIEASSGEIQWTAETLSCTHVPVIARDMVMGAFEPSSRLAPEHWDESGGKIVAFDAHTGDVVWEYDRLGTDDMGTTAAAGDEVVYGRHLRGLFAIDAANGELIWEFESPLPYGLDPDRYQYAPVLTSQPTIVDGAIVVGTPAGGVYAVGEA